MTRKRDPLGSRFSGREGARIASLLGTPDLTIPYRGHQCDAKTRPLGSRFSGREGTRTPDLINVSDALLFDFQNFVGWFWYGVFDKNLLERTS